MYYKLRKQKPELWKVAEPPESDDHQKDHWECKWGISHISGF